MSIELLSLVGSAVASFIFKMYANSQADKQEQMKWALSKAKQNEVSVQNARNFQPNSYVRRFIAISFTAVFLYIMTRTGTITYMDEIIKESYFFGLWGGGTELVTKELSGPILTKDFIQLVYVIVGFYFGKDMGTR